jgi:hypothetical protein
VELGVSPLRDLEFWGYAFLALWAKGEPLNFSGAHFLEMSKLQGKADALLTHNKI